ncbi:MAG: DUF2834 domain-containing protein [Cyanothece sp. SIO1E1]|nr:DUF2834 domain-containing protein [Cyanothece sp. SIO1E1]
MIRKFGFGLLWIGLVAYAFLLAPPAQPETLDLIRHLSTGQWNEINPAIIALFNLMGIWPMIYACLALIDGRGQRLPAWPFVAGSFAFGAFMLLPYLALRSPDQTFIGEKNRLINLLDSRLTGSLLTAGTMILLAYGLIAGDWGQFITQWQASRFIHVMSLDFCLLCLLVPALLGDDMARRGLKDQRIFWAVALIPLLGVVIYLACRPPLLAAASATLQTALHN